MMSRVRPYSSDSRRKRLGALCPPTCSLHPAYSILPSYCIPCILPTRSPAASHPHTLPTCSLTSCTPCVVPIPSLGSSLQLPVTIATSTVPSPGVRRGSTTHCPLTHIPHHSTHPLAAPTEFCPLVLLPAHLARSLWPPMMSCPHNELTVLSCPAAILHQIGGGDLAAVSFPIPLSGISSFSFC